MSTIQPGEDEDLDSIAGGEITRRGFLAAAIGFSVGVGGVSLTIRYPKPSKPAPKESVEIPQNNNYSSNKLPDKKLPDKSSFQIDNVPNSFTWLRDETFSCGGQTNKLPVFHCDAYNMKPEKTDPSLEFILVPGGSYIMGSPDDEVGRYSESPSTAPEDQHKVNVKPFLIARTEVTQQVWENIIGFNPSYFKSERNPVEQVAWRDVQGFMKNTGLRLPSEAEWEYACRAGTNTRFCFGDSANEIGLYAWFQGNSGTGTRESRQTHDVALKLPNAFGLFDMHGNVEEWCKDNYNGIDLYRIIRGGGLGYAPRLMRSAMRTRRPKRTSSRGLGFRPVISLD